MSSNVTDSLDLEALFDQVAATALNPVSEPQPTVSPAAAEPAEGGMGAPECTSMYDTLGHMTRQLHNTLRELGYDQKLQHLTEGMPDTRDRLAYIATVTEQAATKALNAVDVAMPIQTALETQSLALRARWDTAFNNSLGLAGFRALAAETRDFLGDLPAQTTATREQLTEIMMAQDFQDLTGQVIKRVVQAAQDLEGQLVSLLVLSSPQEKKQDIDPGLLNGPVVNAEGRTDVVTSQAQVDDLLDSLGF